jgi:hypothetical protein
VSSLAEWIVMLIAAILLLFSGGCAFFSDGAIIDYSRLINIPLTIGSAGGHSAPWDADYGYKSRQDRSYVGIPPWSSSSIDIEGTDSSLEFKNYRSQSGPWTHDIVTCRKVGKITFCN